MAFVRASSTATPRCDVLYIHSLSGTVVWSNVCSKVAHRSGCVCATLSAAILYSCSEVLVKPADFCLAGCCTSARRRASQRRLQCYVDDDAQPPPAELLAPVDSSQDSLCWSHSPCVIVAQRSNEFTKSISQG